MPQKTEARFPTSRPASWSHGKNGLSAGACRCSGPHVARKSASPAATFSLIVRPNPCRHSECQLHVDAAMAIHGPADPLPHGVLPGGVEATGPRRSSPAWRHAAKQPGAELALGHPTTRAQAAEIQVSGLRPAVPRRPWCNLQRLQRPATPRWPTNPPPPPGGGPSGLGGCRRSRLISSEGRGPGSLRGLSCQFHFTYIITTSRISSGQSNQRNGLSDLAIRLAGAGSYYPANLGLTVPAQGFTDPSHA